MFKGCLLGSFPLLNTSPTPPGLDFHLPAKDHLGVTWAMPVKGNTRARAYGSRGMSVLE